MAAVSPALALGAGRGERRGRRPESEHRAWVGVEAMRQLSRSSTCLFLPTITSSTAVPFEEVSVRRHVPLSATGGKMIACCAEM